MREKILEFINSANFHPLTGDELFSALKLDNSLFVSFCKEIAALEEENIIYISSSNLIHLSSELNIVIGTIKTFTRSYAKVLVDNSLIDVPYTSLANAFIGDTIKLKLNDYNKGEVIEILAHGNSEFVAIYNHNDFYFEDSNAPYKIKVINPNNIKNRNYVLLKIVKINNNLITAKYLKTIGPINSFYSLIDKEIVSAGIKKDFDNEIINEIVSRISFLNEHVEKREEIDETIVTIDGNDAKDFDDAISVSFTSNGNYYLGVHIADVSEYVLLNSKTDCEAFTRGTSIYLPNMVIPMLPSLLSDDKCSLRKDSKKLAISTFMEIDYDGNVISFDIKKTIIKVKDNLHYEDVEKLFNHQESTITDSKIKEMLFNAKNLSSILSKYYNNRGFINLDINELVIKDQNGKISLNKRSQLEAEKLIENFMILTNETIASYVFYMNLPYIYRIHDTIPTPKLKNLITELNNLNIKPPFNLNSKISPNQISTLLNKNNKEILSPIILKSMSKAVYSIDNIGHFGIASKCYCHFTSPIRRYPDLICHRLLKNYLNGDYETDINNLVMIAENSSVCERKAIELERNIDDIYAAKYMEEHLNEMFEATITGFMKYGMFVKLSNGVEGLLRYDTMSDYFTSNENFFFAKYKVGVTVYVKVVSTNINYGEINFAQVRKKEYDKSGEKIC